MIFEIFGFFVTSFLASILIAYFFTKDIYPLSLKRRLIQIFIENWQNGLSHRVNPYKPEKSKSTREDGFVSFDQNEIEIEKPAIISNKNENDQLTFYGVDYEGCVIFINFQKFEGHYTEVLLYFSTGDNGHNYFAIHKLAGNFGDFSLGPLKLECVEPMRIWRIFYNGILIWKAIDCPRDSQRDSNQFLISQILAQKGKFGFGFDKILSEYSHKGYNQYGSLHGQVKILTSKNEVKFSNDKMYLYGQRVRKLPWISNGGKIDLEFFILNGFIGHSIRLHGNEDNWTDGYLFSPSMIHSPIISLDYSAKAGNFACDKSLPKYFQIQGKKQNFALEILAAKSYKLEDLELVSLVMTSGGEPSRGLLIRTLPTTDKNQNQRAPKFEISKSINSNSSIDMIDLKETVTFDHKQLVSLVGGKGASLLKLAEISSKTDKRFELVKGFCTTTELFKKILDLGEIEKIFQENLPGNLQLACEKVKEKIKNSKAVEILDPLVAGWMRNVFDLGKSKKFAVRSSGILEELSCAGQNETFLGLEIEQIAPKIVDCWISLFTPQSVGYRLNHCSEALSQMGVVVQEMVQAQSAGVLFTADPIDGNPFKIIINGNFGLGESVVSASCDPDQIILRNDRQKGFKICDKKLGSKSSKIVMTSDGDSGGTIQISNENSSNFCISDEVALDLAEICMSIEEEFGQLKPVDIEWALDKDGQIYILQCRNITSLDSWTDFELIHEFDTPLLSTQDLYTSANTGEVVPWAMAPLTMSIVQKSLDGALQKSFWSRQKIPINPHSIRTLGVFRQRLLLNMFQIMYRNVEPEPSKKNLALDLSIFGRPVLNQKIYEDAIRRFGIPSPIEGLKDLLAITMAILLGKWRNQAAEKKFGKYKIELCDEPQELFEKITREIFQLSDACDIHCKSSECSGMSQFFLLIAVTSQNESQSDNIRSFEDISKILASCDKVESADIPGAMENLGNVLISQGQGQSNGSSNGFFKIQNFLESKPEIALEMIRNERELNQEFENFMEKHGHRCIAELDLLSKSWSQDPTSFVHLLQNILRVKLAPKSNVLKPNKKMEGQNLDDLISSLKSPMTKGIKRFLKFVIPYAKNAVTSREMTKSLLVRVADQIKKAFAHLGQNLVFQGFLPNEKILFFLSHYEIGQLIENKQKNGPTIIAKALRRMKLYESLNKENFPEIICGMPEPMAENVQIILGNTIQATPVSVGRVQGVAKVCLNVFEAAGNLKNGDILITHSTDIGWSPFFPMLGGIVTELGGLISHGAVVAREYGLPCIVGAANATKIFKTGDQVILDAGQGTLSKVKK